MRKRTRRTPRLTGRVLLPDEIQKKLLPLHMALELLPLGMFQRAHADALALIINVVSVDAVDKAPAVYAHVEKASEVLIAMKARVDVGKNWGATSDERKTLMTAIVEFDKYLRRWTTARWDVAATTVNVLNAKFKAEGGQFLELRSAG